MHTSKATLFVHLPAAAVIAFGSAMAAADEHASCDAFLPDPRTVLNQDVGPESCLMHEADMTYMGR
ncbi:MAG: hypothetical protein OEM51_12575, partial [Gammaproteobacteria bacterium]|nr:hypothetical protein [Gammaproteobacteria bacterium]